MRGSSPPFISQCSATTFRNYNHLSLESDAMWTVFFGENGSGKTNILELLLLNLRGILLRGSLIESIQWGEETTRLSTTLSDTTHFETVVVRDGNRGKRQCFINNEEQHHQEYSSFLSPRLVLFLPGEEVQFLSLAGRRQLLSRGCILRSQRYTQTLRQFHHNIKQKNSLLRQWKGTGSSPSENEYNAWSQTLTPLMVEIWKERSLFFSYLQRELPRVLEELGGIRLPLTFQLVLGGIPRSFTEIPTESDIERFMGTVQEKEYRRGVSLLGPHRDEWLILYEGRNILPLLSRGEQRILLFAFHFLEAQYQKDEMQRSVFLLDDIYSELDTVHQQAIYRALQDEQVFLTTADAHIADTLLSRARLYTIRAGVLT